MWREKLLILLSSLSRTQLLYIALFLLGFILLSGGLIYSLRSSNSGQASQDVIFESAGTTAEKAEQKMAVDIEGAVIAPGVYSLGSNSRIKDALIAAGGLSSGADRVWVEKNINLASKLVDGVKIYIPRLGDSTVISTKGSVSSNLVNINSASLAELDSLSGVGPATAQKIIDNRPYSKIEELTLKKIVTSKVFEKIKDKISIY